MTTELFLLSFCLVIIVLLIVFRNTSFVKKYWRYSLILIPAIVILVLKILTSIRSKNIGSNAKPNNVALKDEVLNIKEQLEEVNTVVKIEAAVAKTENNQLMTSLKEAQKIKDNKERRKRLAELMG